MTRSAAIEGLFLTLGRIACVGFWFVGVLLVYRGLGTSDQGLEQAGLFAISIACIKMASGFISDPVDLAVMQRVPGLLLARPDRGFDVLRASFGIRMSAALLVAGFFAIAAPLAGTFQPKWQSAAPYLQYVAIAIIGDTLIRALMVVMQASQRFRGFLLLEGLVSIIRFVAVVILWLEGAMRVDLVLAFYAGASFAVAVLGIVLLPSGLAGSMRVLRADVMDIVHYLKWMVPAMFLAAANERVDVLLVYNFSGASFAGLYSAALTLALIPDILGGCLSTLIQPRIMLMHERGTFIRSLRQFLSISLPVCGAGFVLAILLAEPIFGALLGPKYVASAPAFYWLLAGTLFWLAVTPLPMNLVAVAMPRRMVFITIAQSAIVAGGGILLLPRLGWIGMAQAIFVMRVVVALLILATARKIAASPFGADSPSIFPPQVAS